MPSPTSLRRLLPALAGVIVIFVTSAGVAHAEFGELSGSPVDLTGKVSESEQASHAFGVDPTDDSFYVGDEVVEGETAFYRIQKFSASGAELAEIRLKVNPNSAQLGERALEGIAVDPANKRVYLLVDREREPEEGEPVFDPESPAAAALYAFSTEVKNANKELEPAQGTKNAEGMLISLNAEAKTARTALIDPHGIAVDPTNGEVIILGQEDLQMKAGEPEELRTAVQRVHISEPSGSASLVYRYVDINNCLDGGEAAGGESACEEGPSVGAQPYSPIVVPGINGASEGRVYAERGRELWEIPASKTELEPKRFETDPKRLLPTALSEELTEQPFLEFPKSAEELAEEVGGTMAFSAGSSEGEGKFYLNAATSIPGNKTTIVSAAALVIGYSEKSGTPEAKEIGWTAGHTESAGEKCSIVKKGNDVLQIAGGEKENIFVFDAHVKVGTVSPAGVDIFGFGPGGAGCPHTEATTPSVKVKDSEGKEVEVSPVPLGEPTTLSSTLTEGNAKKVVWKFKNVTTGEKEETVEEPVYQFQTTNLPHKFEEPGTYDITEVIETDDLASPTVEVKREVDVSATPISVEFSHPATATVGTPVRFEAAINDPHETGTPHLKYTWTFGDGQEKSGETTSTSFTEEYTYLAEGTPSVTLKVTDAHGASGEATETISVGGGSGGGGGGGSGSGGGGSGGSGSGGGGSGGSGSGGGSGGGGGNQVGGSPQTKTTEGAPEASIAGNSISVASSGSVALKVSCPAGDSSCSGTVTLRTAGAVAARAASHPRKGDKHKSVLTLASGSFTVAGGQAGTVTLHLSAAGRALLARVHTLRVQATVLAHDPSGASHTS